MTYLLPYFTLCVCTNDKAACLFFLFVPPFRLVFLFVFHSSSPGWPVVYRLHPTGVPPPSFESSLATLSIPPPGMTAVNNLHMMSTNVPLDFLPAHPSHSRSNSVSSSSTHSSHSRPQSSHGQVNMNRLQPGVGPSAEDLYRGSYHLGHQNLMHNDSVRLLFFPEPLCLSVNQLNFPSSF